MDLPGRADIRRYLLLNSDLDTAAISRFDPDHIGLLLLGALVHISISSIAANDASREVRCLRFLDGLLLT